MHKNERIEMGKSLVVQEKFSEIDLIDGRSPVERHHLIGGTAPSDEDGLWVPLTRNHHTGGRKPAPGVRCDAHHCGIFAKLLQIIGQLAFEKEYYRGRYLKTKSKVAETGANEDPARDFFKERYGRSYL